MRFITVLCLSLLSVAAFAQKKDKKDKEEAEYPLQSKQIMGKQSDSLVANPNLSPVALQMYLGKKTLGTDKATLAVMDSAAKVTDPELRPMYIHLLMFANKMAEEDLGDMLGKYNIALLTTYPKEVLRYFKKGDTDERIADAEKRFQYNIAVELNTHDDPKSDLEDMSEKIFKLYKVKDTAIMDALLKGIKKQMK
jgi:hypothetical protein